MLMIWIMAILAVIAHRKFSERITDFTGENKRKIKLKLKSEEKERHS